jgi:hypothetical protein
MAVIKIGRRWRDPRPPLPSADSWHASVDAWIDEAAKVFVTSEPSQEAHRALFVAIAGWSRAAGERPDLLRGSSWLTTAAVSIAMVLLALVTIRVVVPLASPVEARAAEGLLLQLSESGFAFWINESLVGYPGFLFLHTLGLALVVGLGSAVDLRLLGVAARVPLASFRTVIPAIWTGFLLSTLSGIFLFSADAPGKGEHPLFAIKLTLVACGVLMTAAIERHLLHGETGLSPARARMLAIASLLIWIAAVIAGRLVGYVAEGALL